MTGDRGEGGKGAGGVGFFRVKWRGGTCGEDQQQTHINSDTMWGIESDNSFLCIFFGGRANWLRNVAKR